MSLSLFENMYYKLPENEREVFLNGLNKEDRENLLLNVGKKIVNESISDSQKEYFNNIYNSIEDLKIKNSFLNILFILDDDKREALLKILSSKYKCKNTDYIYNYHIKEIGVYEKGLFFNSHIKNILNKENPASIQGLETEFQYLNDAMKSIDNKMQQESAMGNILNETDENLA